MSEKEVFWIEFSSAWAALPVGIIKPDCPKGRRAEPIACDSGATERKVFQRFAVAFE